MNGDEERARYDRQVRLWGSTTQRRLMATHIDFYSVRGALAEVAKNLVLAGVRSVCIRGATAVTVPDIKSNFLLQNGITEVKAVDLSFEELCTRSLNKLNPHVRTTVAAAEGNACNSASEKTVVLANASSVSEIATVLTAHPHADLIVVTVSSSAAVLSLFFHGPSCDPGEPASVDAQRDMLLSDPEYLSKRPAAYQAVVLDLHLADMTDCPGWTIGGIAAVKVSLVQRLQLYELSGDDVDEAGSGALCGGEDAVSVILATQAGAGVAQQVISLIGSAGGGGESTQWMLCRACPTMETLIG